MAQNSRKKTTAEQQICLRISALSELDLPSLVWAPEEPSVNPSHSNIVLN